MNTPPTAKQGDAISSPWLPNGRNTLNQLFGVWEYIPELHINAPHEGIDVGAKHGDPVVLPAGEHAMVTGAGWDTHGGGNFVQLKTDAGDTIQLFHLQDVAVKVGQDLSGGVLLGHVDSTGNSTGDHLHFQVNDPAGKPVDPWSWLTATPAAAGVGGASGNPLDSLASVGDFFGHLTNPGHDPCSAPSSEVGVLRIIDAVSCPQNWWKTLFVGIGVAMIGAGVFVYFFKEEAKAVVEIAPLAAEAA